MSEDAKAFKGAHAKEEISNGTFTCPHKEGPPGREVVGLRMGIVRGAVDDVQALHAAPGERRELRAHGRVAQVDVGSCDPGTDGSPHSFQVEKSGPTLVLELGRGCLAATKLDGERSTMQMISSSTPGGQASSSWCKPWQEICLE